jgi:hypothetical protein
MNTLNESIASLDSQHSLKMKIAATGVSKAKSEPHRVSALALTPSKCCGSSDGSAKLDDTFLTTVLI